MHPACMKKKTQRLKKCAAFSFFVWARGAWQGLRANRSQQAEASLLFLSGFPTALQAHLSNVGQAALPILFSLVTLMGARPAACSPASF